MQCGGLKSRVVAEWQLAKFLKGRFGSDADRRPYSLNDTFVAAPDLAGEISQPHRLAGRLRLEGAAGPLRSEGSSRPIDVIRRSDSPAAGSWVEQPYRGP